MDFRIKEILHEKGVSMSWLSKETNIASETLYRIGSRNPTIGTCEKIADALGVGLTELFEARTNICARCGNRIDEVAVVVKTPPPPQETKTGISLLGFVEKCTDKVTDSIGLIGLIKHLRAYDGDGALITDVDDKFYDGFIEYLKSAKKTATGCIVKEIYQKRLKSCFDEVIAIAKENSTVSLDIEA